MQTSLIIEGIDRLGKSTLINGIQQKLGFFNYIHYEKPKLLNHILFDEVGSLAFTMEYNPDIDGIKENVALELYQRKSFQSMFNLLMCGERFIMDRGHLGETVYAHRYRGYNGDYVFELEQEALNRWKASAINLIAPKEFPARLILLTTSDFSFIQDDGLSFDFSKKEEEQKDFIKAFDQSKLPKVMIDVADGKGGFRNPEDILQEALNGII